MAVNWVKQTETMFSVITKKCFPKKKFLNTRFFHVRRQISEVLSTIPTAQH
jgi:hypothetical protein